MLEPFPRLLEIVLVLEFVLPLVAAAGRGPQARFSRRINMINLGE
jgi:hypothetical protein